MKRNLSLYLLAFACILTTSCKKEIDEAPDAVESGEVSVSALTATINGSFNGYTNSDYAYATFGILYCPSSDKSESIFQSWKDGNDKPECQILKNGTISTKGSFTAKIENLTPDTEYDYCLFFLSEDKTRRETGEIQKMKTATFNPTFNFEGSDDIMHYTATVNGILSSIDANDLNLCTIGMVLSDTEEIDPNTGRSFAIDTKDMSSDGSFSIQFSDLRAGHSYWYKPYVKINQTGEYALGQLRSFTTESADDMMVDLGLSVKWADWDLGTDDRKIPAPCYAWGHLISYGNKYHKLQLSQYKYWDSSKGNYVEIGSDICGTEYDVAHYLLGGKWRMPRKTEVEELFNLNVTVIDIEGADGNDYGLRFTADNGNFIEMTSTLRWTGNLCDSLDYVSYWGVDTDAYTPYMYNSNILMYKDAYLKVLYPRECEAVIRPVWDPNM